MPATGPGRAALIAWLFTAAAAITATQRIALGVHTLRRPAAPLPTEPAAPGAVMPQENRLPARG